MERETPVAETKAIAPTRGAFASLRPVLGNGPRVDSHSGPLIAVVIPAYKQPALLGEAIQSALQQNTTLRVAVIIVDDGCPLKQTQEVGQAYATAFPQRVYYIRRQNGGLSAARNTGVAFALDSLEDVRAIYFLDADNRIFPDFLQRAWDALAASGAEVGWAYPDVDMFGFSENYSVRGDYSLLMHLLENYCEAGSLVRRSVFEHGVRFDEGMRHGFEDWDFWLQAAAAGFRGRHLPQSGFRYRRRAESMLTSSERMRQTILTYLRQKHKELLSVGHLLKLEASELPRFAVHKIGANRVELLVDPVIEGVKTLGITNDREQFINACLDGRTHSYPDIVCFSSPTALEAMKFYGVIRNLFWLAQVHLEKQQVVIVRLVSAEGSELSLTVTENNIRPEDVQGASLLFVRTQIVRESVLETSSGWLRLLGSASSGPSKALITLAFPEFGEKEFLRNFDVVADSVAEGLFREIDTLRALWQRRAPAVAEWRTDARIPRNHVQNAYDSFCSAKHIFPHLASDSQIDVGLILPLFSFGGVEKVVLNYARGLRARGFRPHLFITATRHIQFDSALTGVFESLNFVDSEDVEAAKWDAGYFGVWSSAYGASPQSSHFVGLLATMRIVLNTHSLGAHGLMARLRALGVKTYLGLHLVERGPFDQPIGNPHVALAYEHAYDGFVVISEQLKTWCIGQGIPREKLYLVANAPSYETSPSKIADSLAQRRGRESGSLNVVFLGRLDFQKGIDRLASVVRRTQSPKIQWRVVGKAIVENAAEDLEGLGVPIEPPVHSAADLDRLYQWADVVVLCSRFEGVPLTILEAQRFGCVALATDVGAVSEIVRNGVDGLLVSARQSEEEIVADFVNRLHALANDRRRVTELGTAAANRLEKLSWDLNLTEWIDALSAAIKTDVKK